MTTDKEQTTLYLDPELKRLLAELAKEDMTIADQLYRSADPGGFDSQGQASKSFFSIGSAYIFLHHQSDKPEGWFFGQC